MFFPNEKYPKNILKTKLNKIFNKFLFFEYLKIFVTPYIKKNINNIFDVFRMKTTFELSGLNKLFECDKKPKPKTIIKIEIRNGIFFPILFVLLIKPYSVIYYIIILNIHH